VNNIRRTVMVSAAAGSGSAVGVLATTMQGTASAADVLAAFSRKIMPSVVRAMACRLRLAVAGDMSLLLRDLTACMTRSMSLGHMHVGGATAAFAADLLSASSSTTHL
jgi:hypothetical protein